MNDLNTIFISSINSYNLLMLSSHRVKNPNTRKFDEKAVDWGIRTLKVKVISEDKKKL